MLKMSSMSGERPVSLREQQMFRKILKVIFVFYCLAGFLYLALPDPSFPTPPPDSIKSLEPADLENPLRQGYFTNYSRDEVLDWYGKQFDHINIFGFDFKIPTPLLNYPPEYAQSLIRDQTSSTFLQEYVHPFRESIYINGFKPETKDNTPAFFVDGQKRDLKIIIRQVKSSVVVREILFILSSVMMIIIYLSIVQKSKKRL